MNDTPAKVPQRNSGEVEVESREEMTLRKKAEVFHKKSADLQKLYFSLCSYIREKQLEPAVVRRALLAAGFPKSRVSEVFKVSFVSEEIWLEYKAKTIGFKLAYQAAVDEKAGKTHNPKTRLRNRLLAVAHRFEEAALFLEDKDLALIVPDLEKLLAEGKELTFENAKCLVTVTAKGAK